MKRFFLITLFLMLCISAEAQSKYDENAICPTCKVLAKLDGSLKMMQDSAGAFIHEEDYCGKRCLLALMDTLTQRYIKTSKLEYLITLDSIACYSDGYVSEMLDIKAIRLFYHNFKPYVDFLYHNGDTNNCMVKYLIWGMSEGDSDNSTPSTWKEIEEYIAKQKKKYNLPRKECVFLNVIVKKAKWSEALDK